MDIILTGNVWKQIVNRAKGAKRRLAAVAYVSSGKYLKFTRGDILICDASIAKSVKKSIRQSTQPHIGESAMFDRA